MGPRLFRLLLRAYPPPFRRLFAEELESDFEALLCRARRRGRGAVVRLWGRTVVDTLATGARERLSRRGYRVGRSGLRIPRRGAAAWVVDAGADLRLAARSLPRSRGYAAAVIGTLALGIGANTALFSVAYGTLLRPLPFLEGDRLVRLVQEAPPAADPGGAPERAGFSVADLESYATEVPGLAEVSEVHSMTFTLIDAEGPHRVRASVVSANYFDFLGLEAVHGRVLHPDEDHLGSDPVIVLAHGYWMERFGGDPGVVGTRVRMNDRVHEIVGVLPPRPQFPLEAEIYLPVSACPTRSDPAFIADRRARMMFAYGRLGPGATVPGVTAQVDSVLGALAAAHPAAYPLDSGFRTRTVALRDDMAAEVRPVASALLVLAALVLLVACANAAGLALARAGRRARELEVRGALGAGRSRLVRMLLAESLLLAAVGGTLGLGVAVAGHDLLVEFASRFSTRAGEIRLDGAVLGFTAAVSIAVGVAFGTVPGLWAGGRMGGSAARHTPGRRGRALQRGLVAGQVAVAFAVATAAGLAARTAWAVGTTALGFETASVVSFEVALDQERWRSTDSARALFGRLTVRLEAHPAVTRAVRAMGGPLTDHRHVDRYRVGDAGAGVAPEVGALARVVDPGVFEMLGMGVREGRTFLPSDTVGAPAVAIVNRAFLDAAPVGAGGPGTTLIRCHGPDECLPPLRVVGVVDDVRFDGVDAGVGPEVYQVASQAVDYGGEHLLVEVRGDPAAVEDALVAAVHEVEPDLAVSDYAPLQALRRGQSHPRRFFAALLGTLAAVAVGLAVTGIFGVASLSAAARRRELGVRRALGAPPAGLARLVLWEGLGVAAVGVAAGLALASVGGMAFDGVARRLLWGVEPHDPATLVGVAVLFVTVAVAATWLPARSAAALDVTEVLNEP